MKPAGSPPKARRSRQGSAAGAAATAAAGGASDEAGQQTEAEAPRSKRQRREKATVPELEGPPCFSSSASLVHVGTSGEEASSLPTDIWIACIGMPKWVSAMVTALTFACCAPMCLFGCAGWQYPHWRGPDGFYGGELREARMGSIASMLPLLGWAVHL